MELIICRWKVGFLAFRVISSLMAWALVPLFCLLFENAANQVSASAGTEAQRLPFDTASQYAYLQTLSVPHSVALLLATQTVARRRVGLAKRRDISAGDAIARRLTWLSKQKVISTGEHILPGNTVNFSTSSGEAMYITFIISAVNKSTILKRLIPFLLA